MFNWLKSLSHGTAGEYLVHLKDKAEGSYHARVAQAEQAYAGDMAVVGAIAHTELTALQHMVDHAQERARTLIAAGVDMGDRNVEAAALHLHLSNAVNTK